MQKRESDAKELYRLIHGAITDSPLSPAGIWGPIGVERGIQEELLKQTGIVSGKIISSHLTNKDIDEYFALCQLAQANNVIATSDLNIIERLLDRSTKNGPNI